MGIIADKMKEQTPAEGPATGAPTQEAPAQRGAEEFGAGTPAPKYKSRAVEALPPAMHDAFERVVLAGMKGMYSKQSSELLEQELSAKGEMWQKLATAITGLMMILDRQSGKGIPVQVVIPAAIELLYEAAEFIRKTKRAEISDEDMKDATQYLGGLLAKKYGANDEQISGMFGGGKPAAEGGAVTEPGAEQQLTMEGGGDGVLTQ